MTYTNKKYQAMKMVNKQRLSLIGGFFFTTFIIGIALFFLQENAANNPDTYVNGIGLFISSVIGIGLLFDWQNKRNFKNNVLQDLFEDFVPGYSCMIDEQISYDYMKKSGILPSHNQKTTGTLIRGTNQDLNIELCNLILQTRRSSGKTSTVTTEFYGIFIKIKLDKQSPCSFKLGSKWQWNLLGHKLGSNNLEKLEVVAPSLNKKAKLYTDDQVAVRTILKPVVLEQLEQLVEKYKLQISVYDNQLNIMIDKYIIDTKPRFFLFEPLSYDKKGASLKRTLDFVDGVIQELNFHRLFQPSK